MSFVYFLMTVPYLHSCCFIVFLFFLVKSECSILLTFAVRCLTSVESVHPPFTAAHRDRQVNRLHGEAG